MTDAQPTDDFVKVQRDDALVLVGGLRRLRRPHRDVEDCWYSCPKSEGGCCNDAIPADECDCGADTLNALVDALLALIEPALSDRSGS